MQDNVMCYHNDSIQSETTTMPDVLIRNVPSKTLAALKVRARKNKRSLQAELLNILERESVAEQELPVKAKAEAEFWALAEKIRASITQKQTDSALLIAEDRKR